ncbi:hypothetical protein BURKHO8Y_30206 [Burkholderia sp. 8Y]|nr:hypothetical protein BURKHO8Y_30206 [Burkholderia sp. 8Y]
MFPHPAMRAGARRNPNMASTIAGRQLHFAPTSHLPRTCLGPLDGGGYANAPVLHVVVRRPVKRRRVALVGCESGIDAAATPFWCAQSATFLYSRRDILGAGRRWRDAIL